ncbi:hypothetical protein BH92_07520 [Rhodococcoides fascians A21d2]|nr:dihydrofolate reductase [Rhodococcus sp. 14-2470-1b]QIH99732.1 hypothetical protein BH92_07520 [Rhodococcus fascians A21d2]
MGSYRTKLIVAHDGGRGIGKGGVIPWKIPGEQKRVAEITKSTTKPEAINAIIMGRSTYLSLPSRYRPLRDRLNVVVTSRFPPDHGIETAGTIDEALETSLSHPRVESVFSSAVSGSTMKPLRVAWQMFSLFLVWTTHMNATRFSRKSPPTILSPMKKFLFTETARCSSKSTSGIWNSGVF